MPKTDKLDLMKLHKNEYAMPKEPVLVNVKPAKYLGVVGKGKPGSDLFQAQIGALYGLAYTIKMTRKSGGGEDFKVCTLEGLYWPADPSKCIMDETNTFNWKLMIRMPGSVTQKEFNAALAAIKKKGKAGPFDDVRLETIKEGKCVQVLHVGPYDAERPTIARMQAFVESKGLKAQGLHHEIYMSDPRRIKPEKLKTILRQPVVAAATAKATGA